MQTLSRSGYAALWRPAMWGTIAALLVLPLVLMPLTREVRWTAFDFACAAALLVGAGACVELVARKVRSPARRAALAGLIALVVALVWIEGAVGIFS